MLYMKTLPKMDKEFAFEAEGIRFPESALTLNLKEMHVAVQWHLQTLPQKMKIKRERISLYKPKICDKFKEYI